MKLALLLALPFLAAPSGPAPTPARAADTLRVSYRADTTATLVEREWTTMEASDISMLLNGEEAPEGMLEEMGMGFPSEREDNHVELVTRLEEVEDGRPVRAQRSFDTLERTRVKDDVESESEGVLEGRTLHLTGSAADDEVEARLADDDEGPEIDDLYLEDHRLVLDFEHYFSEREVEVGDTWELDEDAVRKILGIDHDGPIYFEPDDDESDDEALDDWLHESVTVSGEIEYESREEIDGVMCAVLVVNLRAEIGETEVDPSTLGMQEEEGMEASVELSFRLEGTEHLWFAIEEGRPVKSEAEMEGGMDFHFVITVTEFDLEMDITVSAEIEGGFERNWSYEEEG